MKLACDANLAMLSATKAISWLTSGRLDWDELMAKVKENFARNLRLLLERDGKKPIDLARHLETSPSTVTRWVNGETTPALERLDDIADFFHETTYLDLITDKSPAARRKDLDDLLREFASLRGFRLVPKS